MSVALLEAAQRLVGWSWGEFLDKKHPSYRKLREDLTHFHNVVSSATAAQKSSRFGDGGGAAKEIAALAARLGVLVMHPSELRKQRGEAHVAGYAEAVADVVAWLRRGSEEACRIADGIEDKCHVGAAKRGGT